MAEIWMFLFFVAAAFWMVSTAVAVAMWGKWWDTKAELTQEVYHRIVAEKQAELYDTYINAMLDEPQEPQAMYQIFSGKN